MTRDNNTRHDAPEAGDLALRDSAIDAIDDAPADGAEPIELEAGDVIDEGEAHDDVEHGDEPVFAPALVDESAFEGADDEDDDLPLHFDVVAHPEDGAEAGDRPPPEPEGTPEIPLELIDPDALWVVRRLHAKGYEAYLTGGCVRDLLLGRQPKDFDVATAAHPNQVKAVFRNCRLVGRRFRLAHVFFPSGKVIETATFRANPIDELEDLPQDLLVERDNVFGNVEQDARRRDLTVNGLFYDPLKGKVLDFVDGRTDLEACLIRTIGDPEVRFREDPVRILRAIKFATRLGFAIEERTLSAMKAHVGELVRCAPARLQEELLRLLTSGHAAEAWRLCESVGVVDAILPEFSAALDEALEPRPLPVRPQPAPPVRSAAEASVVPAVEAQPASLAENVVDAPRADHDPAPAVGLAPDQAAESGAEAETETEARVNQTSAPVAALVAASTDADTSPATAATAPAPFTSFTVIPSPAERRARLAFLLLTLDEARQRDLELTSAAAFAVLLVPVWEARSASTSSWDTWFEAATQSWTERIRFTRHDKERVAQVLTAQDDLLPHRRRGQPARALTHRPSFKESLLVYTLRLHAAGLPLDEVGLWKVVAQAAGALYRQPRLSERAPRLRAAGRGGGAGRGRGRDRDRGRRRRR